MMLRVQRYDFTVSYKPGKYMFIADALSRAPLAEKMSEDVSSEVEIQSCFLIENVRFSHEKLDTVRNFVTKDKDCQLLIDHIKHGWPSDKYQVQEPIRAYWSFREALEYVDGVIFKDKLVLIPSGLRGEMLRRVHEGHLGADRCKRRARDVMYWPGMSRAVEQLVRRCRLCALHAARPQREPMIPHPLPTLPWVKLGSDIFEYKKDKYLVLVDYYSNFIEVSLLNSITSKCVINAIKEQFARHGIAKELVTDNGPAYASKEFRAFASEWGFNHVTTSPHYPQSNGRSERSVRTIKSLLLKSIDAKSDFYMALLNFRSTPRDGIASPAQLLMGRRLNTLLPTHEEKLKPERDNSVDIANLQKKQRLSKSWYDGRARALPELQVGEEVLTAAGGARRQARVTARAPQPRSYFVQDRNGHVYRRNRRHLIRLAETQSQLVPPIVHSQQVNSEDGIQVTASSSCGSDDYDSCKEFDENLRSCESRPRANKGYTERAAARVAKNRLKTTK